MPGFPRNQPKAPDQGRERKTMSIRSCAAARRCFCASASLHCPLWPRKSLSASAPSPHGYRLAGRGAEKPGFGQRDRRRGDQKDGARLGGKADQRCAGPSGQRQRHRPHRHSRRRPRGQLGADRWAKLTDHTNYGQPLLIDPGSIDRIEVVRGSSSVISGSCAIGGVVNIITKKGAEKPFGLTTQAGYMSATDGYRLSATARVRWRQAPVPWITG